MATPLQILKLLESVGPFVEELDTILQIDEQTFAFKFEDESGLLMFCDTPAHRLTLARAIGVVQPHHKAEVHEAILRANGFWQQSEGVSVALDDDDQIVIVKHVFSDVDVPYLVAIVEDLLDKSAVWQQIVNSEPEMPSHDLQTSTTEQAASMMKV